MQMMKGRKSYVIVALISVFSVALAFSAASLITNAQLAATDVNLINIKSVYKTVWYREAIPQAGFLTSVGAMGSSWGRGTMHLLYEAYGLTGAETMTFQLWAPLWDKAHSSYIPIKCAEWSLDSSDPGIFNYVLVPNAQFFFVVYGPVGSQASLSYYLTLSI